MSWLLDTNVLSELRRKSPDARVVAWVEARPASTLYLSVLTLGEIQRGVEAMLESPRKQALSDWLETELPAFFAGRVLDVNATVAARWGSLLARAGRPLPTIDSLLAATALRHGLTLVTRNVADFADTGVSLFNPWD